MGPRRRRFDAGGADAGGSDAGGNGDAGGSESCDDAGPETREAMRDPTSMPDPATAARMREPMRAAQTREAAMRAGTPDAMALRDCPAADPSYRGPNFRTEVDEGQTLARTVNFCAGVRTIGTGLHDTIHTTGVDLA
ncbi:MAG: hypothetical protein AB8I08_15030 [Sandaracinaceae bacterium]